ncbi:diguanylate cyclase [Arcobacteraceae bacterium]|nr:diguanylate cyclase [Arcobacteraceae bacterium]
MHKILCVDNNEENLTELKLLFKNKIEEFSLIFAKNGNEAINILLKESIDMILLDAMIDDTDGYETAKLIKSNSVINHIPMIFLIENKTHNTIENAFKYGVDYLLKPFDKDVLFTRIKSQFEVLELHNKLEDQISFNQSVLNAQKNMILIHDDNGLINANQSFYSFFCVHNTEEFISTYGSLVSQFMEYENYFSLSDLNNTVPWLSELSSKENTPYSILLLNHNTFQPETFVIDVNPIGNLDKFVITLTNITSIITQSKRYEMKATYDVLTNIYNRNKFNDCIDEQYKLFARYGGELSFAIFDIDFFKQVNDVHGHVVGDETLITFAQTIENNIRNTDVFARWGGEEFTLLLPCTKLEDATFVTNNLRKIIEKLNFKTIGQKTCSIGLTQFKKGDTVDSVLLRADEALYEAKETGRNKVCVR